MDDIAPGNTETSIPESLKRALAESAAGNTVDLGDFTKYIDDFTTPLESLIPGSPSDDPATRYAEHVYPAARKYAEENREGNEPLSLWAGLLGAMQHLIDEGHLRPVAVTEWGVHIVRGDITDPHRTGMTAEEAMKWISDWADMGARPDAAVLVRRTIGPWEIVG